MLSSTVRPLARCALASSRRISLRACVLPRPQRVSVSPRLLLPRRMMATPAPQVNESHLTMEEYHAKADRSMDELLVILEDLVDASGKTDYEVDYHSGVLTLKLGSHGTYVVNKQPPNKQIWLSSPKSGPKRYDFDEATSEWTYARDGQSIDALLSEELSVVFDKTLSIRIRSS